MGMDSVIVATSDAVVAPQLTDYHLVEDCEPTIVMPEPPDYAAQWEHVARLERPTIPIGYHQMPIDSVASLVSKKRR
jgi:hypothetical protein